MTRAFAIALVALATASAPSAQAQRVREVRLAVLGREHTVLLDTVFVWTEVSAPPAEAWSKLRAALGDMEIPIAVADSAHLFLYQPGFPASRKLAGEPITAALHCGEDPTGVDYAASARLTLAIAVAVDSLPNGNAKVGTALVGGARSNEGTSRGPIVCATTGILESRLINHTQLRVVRRF
jgi:hypothetical protein